MITSVHHFLSFLGEIYQRRQMLLQLTRRDFTSRYLGSALGLFWGYIQPAITIAIIIFVFEVGFRVQPIKSIPYTLWFITGIIPWFFIAEAVNSGTNAILEYSYLVKKIAFRASLLPIIKIVSALLIHAFFILALLAIFALYDFSLTLYALQIIYFLFAAIVLVLGLSWFTSALVVFVRDVSQLVAMALNFAFWLTPIMWDIETIPEKYRIVFKLNPFYYIIEGYRRSLIYRSWFWEGDFLLATLVFWLMALTFFVGGAVTFRQLKSHFADAI